MLAHLFYFLLFRCVTYVGGASVNRWGMGGCSGYVCGWCMVYLGGLECRCVAFKGVGSGCGECVWFLDEGVEVGDVWMWVCVDMWMPLCQ